MAWYTVFLIVAVFEIINVALILGGFLIVAKVYSNRFASLTNLMGDAFADRDAAFQKLKANLAHAFVTDTSVFDTSLEDLSDPEVPVARGDTDGREETDQEAPE